MKPIFRKWKCVGCGLTFESTETDGEKPAANYCPRCIDKVASQNAQTGEWNYNGRR